jgi:hypothetical protein
LSAHARPGGQGEGAAEPGGQNSPAPQASAEADGVRGHAYPAGHGVADVLFSEAQSVPFGQGVGATFAVPGQKKPRGHGEAAVVPFEGQKRPEGQGGAAASAGASQSAPGGHVIGATLPVGQNVPGLHAPDGATSSVELQKNPAVQLTCDAKPVVGQNAPTGQASGARRRAPGQ